MSKFQKEGLTEASITAKGPADAFPSSFRRRVSRVKGMTMISDDDEVSAAQGETSELVTRTMTLYTRLEKNFLGLFEHCSMRHTNHHHDWDVLQETPKTRQPNDH